VSSQKSIDYNHRRKGNEAAAREADGRPRQRDKRKKTCKALPARWGTLGDEHDGSNSWGGRRKKSLYYQEKGPLKKVGGRRGTSARSPNLVKESKRSRSFLGEILPFRADGDPVRKKAFTQAPTGKDGTSLKRFQNRKKSGNEIRKKWGEPKGLRIVKTRELTVDFSRETTRRRGSFSLHEK